jgi:hypothetical protein
MNNDDLLQYAATITAQTNPQTNKGNIAKAQAACLLVIARNLEDV